MSARIELPPPRIWKAKDVADFFGMSVSWVYKKTEAKSDDPIPRIPGVKRIACDTQSKAFQDWIKRQLGQVDNDGSQN